MSEQIDNLISMLVRKLATVVLTKASKQYSCQVRDADSETEDLIQVLLLQTITQSKIRLTADNFELYRKTINLNKRIMFSSIFISLETESLSFFISLRIEFLNLSAVVKNKSSIFSLIKKVQEFNLLCRQIFSQLHRKSKRNILFALIRNEILRKMNHY